MPHIPARQTAQALAAAAPLATRWVERLLAAASPPLTVAEYLSLRAIATGESSAAALAEHSGVSEAAVSQVVGQLEDAGLIVRATAPDDRRRRSIELSPEGRDALAKAERVLGERLAEAIGPLPPRDADRLAEALRRIEAALGGLSPPPRPRPPHPPHHHHRAPPHRPG